MWRGACSALTRSLVPLYQHVFPRNTHHPYHSGSIFLPFLCPEGARTLREKTASVTSGSQQHPLPVPLHQPQVCKERQSLLGRGAGYGVCPPTWGSEQDPRSLSPVYRHSPGSSALARSGLGSGEEKNRENTTNRIPSPRERCEGFCAPF